MSVRVRYFAAAAEAAGTDAEDRGESSLAALRAAVLAAHPALVGILEKKTPHCKNPINKPNNKKKK